MGLGDYFAPGKAAKKRQSKSLDNNASLEVPKPLEMVQTPNVPSFSPMSPGQTSPMFNPGTPKGAWSQYTTPHGSAGPSRAASIYPVGDFRNQTMEEINDIKCDVMVNWLHSQQEEKLWTAGEYEEGVVLKKSRGMYTCAPADLSDEQDGFFHAVQELNVRVRRPKQFGCRTSS